MAVINVASIAEPGSWDGSRNRLWQRYYTRTLQVTTDNRTDGPVVIGNDPRVPKPGMAYNVSSAEFDFGSFVEDVSYKLFDFAGETGGLCWHVTVKYGPYDATTFPESPIDWPTVWWWGTAKYEKVLTKDVHGNPVRNSAKEPFEEPIVLDDSRPVLFFERNEWCNTYDPLLANSYRDTLNNAIWNGFAAGTVKCAAITVDKPQKDSITNDYYYTVNYSFEINPDGWARTLLDQGYSVLDSSTPPKPKRLLDGQGQYLSEPVLLDGSGNQLASTGTPVFLSFDVYQSVDFSPLKLDVATGLGR